MTEQATETIAPGTAPRALTPSAQTRVRHIVDAAAAVMGRHGYAATSIKEIAREADIAPGLIHYYFESKEDLLLAVMRVVCDQLLADTRAAFAGAPASNPLLKAWAALEAARDRCAARPYELRLFFEMVSLGFTNPRLREQLSLMYTDITSATAEMVEEMNAMLPCPLPVPTEDFGAVVVAAFDGLALRSLVDPHTDVDALYRALGFLLLSSAASSYAAAGQPMPPLEDLMNAMVASASGAQGPR